MVQSFSSKQIESLPVLSLALSGIEIQNFAQMAHFQIDCKEATKIAAAFTKFMRRHQRKMGSKKGCTDDVLVPAVGVCYVEGKQCM